ncbi:hypothetical protein FACS1894187_08660 [Synergistales bacterium]|nr:hypothetical protein FACS1894187_08660 [Synergistales bacterium]
MKQIDAIDCFACGKKQISKNEIGLNKKMLGREIKQFYCLDCLAEYFEVTTEELLAKIEDFKLQGCALFE